MLASKPIVITQGEKAEFDVFLKNENGRPFDLTAFNTFIVCLHKDGATLSITQAANVNGSVVSKIAPDVLGNLRVVVGPVDSESLKVGDLTDIGIELDNSVTPNKKRLIIEKGLLVQPFDC